MRSPRLALAFVLLTALPATAHAVGEPKGSYPTPDERLLQVLTNRARAAPASIHGSCTDFYNPGPLPPLGWDYDLNRSSRFQSEHLTLADCTLMHPSCCTLNTNVGTSGCNGDPSCACASGTSGINCPMCGTPPTSGCGTDPFTRIGYFYSAFANAENGAAGYADPWSAFQGWIDECPSDPGGDGHRQDILNNTSNQIGNGAAYAGGATACWSSFYFQDFGQRSGYTVPEVPAGAVNPTSGPAGSYDFYVNYWASAGPASVKVVVDGTCDPMSLEMGAATNGTWKATETLGAGCHQYWFLVTDGAGARVTYPTTGALTVAAGASCSAEYVTTATPASCEGAKMPDMGVPPVDSPVGPPPDMKIGPPVDAGMAAKVEPTSLPGDGTPVATGDGGGGVLDLGGGGCACDTGGRRAPPSGALLLLVLGVPAAALRRRRRRRRRA